jgi:hypothetical protein
VDLAAAAGTVLVVASIASDFTFPTRHQPPKIFFHARSEHRGFRPESYRCDAKARSSSGPDSYLSPVEVA